MATPPAKPYPKGPWRPMSGIQRGSIIYTQIYPGDPLDSRRRRHAGRQAPRAGRRLGSASHSHNADQRAGCFRNSREVSEASTSRPVGRAGFRSPTTSGRAATEVHMKLVMDYAERPIYDVIAKLHGTSDDEWVVLGNHHDAWVFGAADPGSGTAAMLETGRALGELVRSGWKPRRTIVICQWDGEEPGLIGSTEWVEANRAELQSKAVVYINTDVGVGGPNFAASATPSLKDLGARRCARGRGSRHGPQRVRRVARARANVAEGESRARRGRGPVRRLPAKPPECDLGRARIFAFFDHAGIPSMDMGFTGDYGVYHSVYDDFYWMKHFGDPKFAYHAALARIMGTIALRLDEADILPFDFRPTPWSSSTSRRIDPPRRSR